MGECKRSQQALCGKMGCMSDCDLAVVSVPQVDGPCAGVAPEKAAQAKRNLHSFATGDAREICERLFVHVQNLDHRISQLENSRVFQFCNMLASKVLYWQGRTASILPRRWRRSQHDTAASAGYTQWINEHESRWPSIEQCRTISEQWIHRPRISIIIIADDFRPKSIERVLRSVYAQSYSEWEVVLVVNGCEDAASISRVRSQFAADKLHIIETDGITPRPHIFSAAATTATGDFLAFLHQHTVLTPRALHYVVEPLQNSTADVIYSDEDTIDDLGSRAHPIFRPAWSPELFRASRYIGDLLVIARQLYVAHAAGVAENSAAPVHDVIFELTNQPITCTHVPKVLCHRYGIREFSGAGVLSHSHTKTSSQRDDTRRWDAMLVHGSDCSNVISFAGDPIGLSIIICSRTRRLAECCVKSFQATAQGPCQFLVVQHENRGTDPDMTKALSALGCTIIPYAGAFNFAAMNNTAVARARHSLLLFLNDDVTAFMNHWWQQLISQLQQPNTGVVGATLRYPSGAIQHAGVVLGLADGVGHAGRFQFESDLWPWMRYTREVSAVTGACMGVRKEVFHELGGFDEDFPNNYNDVDFCLRARAAGYNVVCAGTEGLIHEECKTRAGVTSLLERDRLYRRWFHVLNQPDPYYSTAFARTERIQLAFD